MGKFHLLFPQKLGVDWELKVKLESLLGIRSVPLGDIDKTEVLIKWIGLSPLEATCEPFELINQQFPSFHLANKVTKLAG